MLNTAVKNMFKYDGKTVKIIGKTRIKTYHDLYMQLSQLQKEKAIPLHGNYLGDNELAQNIYKKNVTIGLQLEVREEFCYLFLGNWIQGDFGHDRKKL